MISQCSNIFCASFMTPETSNVCLKKRLDACSFLKSALIFQSKQSFAFLKCHSNPCIMLLQLKLLHRPDQNSFDTWLCVSSSWSLCASLTSSNRKLCTCKLVQVQSFVIVSQHLRITLMMSLYILIGHVNFQS